MSAFFIPAIRPASSAPTASITASSTRALDTREKYPAAVAAQPAQASDLAPVRGRKVGETGRSGGAAAHPGPREGEPTSAPKDDVDRLAFDLRQKSYLAKHNDEAARIGRPVQ